jgi:rhomboid protease GluP
MTRPENESSAVPPNTEDQGIPASENQDKNREPSRKRETIFSVFEPLGRHRITAVLICANVLVFVAMAISGVNLFEPRTESLLKWGAIFRPAILEGEWWRLITCCFIHVGIFHLLVNMYALLYIGIMLEPLLGRVKFLVAYLLTGILASLASVTWNAYTVGAGASGAIFGVYGLFLALLTTQLIHPDIRKPLLKSMVWFVVINLGIGVAGFVDNAAHIGGLVSGFFMGYAYYPALRKPWARGLQSRTAILSIVAVLTLTFFVYRSIPNDVAVYEQKMAVFAARDSAARRALALFMDDDVKSHHYQPRADTLKGISLQNWEQGIRLATEMDKLKLPAELRERNKRMILYCQLQIRYTELMYTTLTGNDTAYKKYDDQIRDTNRQLDSVTKALAGDK